MRGRKAHSSLSSVGVPVGGEAVLLTVSERGVDLRPSAHAAPPAAAAKGPPSTCTATAVTPLPAVVPCRVIWPETLALSLGEVIVTPGPCGMLWPQKAFVQPGSKLQ